MITAEEYIEQHYSQAPSTLEEIKELMIGFATVKVEAALKDKQFSLTDVKKIKKWVDRNYSEVEDELAKPFEDKGEDLDDNFYFDVYQEALKRAINSL